MNEQLPSRRTLAYMAWALSLGVSIGSCIVGDDKCDAHQVEVSRDQKLYSCECEPGYVVSPQGYGCVSCGEHQEVLNGKCVCEAGYERADDSATCEEIEGSELGAACSESEPCANPNPYCATSEDEPYCTTQGCARNDDCPKDWRCGSADELRFCQRPPSGFGDACESSDDCAGKEAAFCETLQTHMCIVSDCLEDPVACPSQSSCCDLKAFVGTSLCVANDFLTDGKCPDGRSPVTQ